LVENFSPSIILSNSNESPKNEISSIVVIILKALIYNQLKIILKEANNPTQSQ
jgi:hypothetical protein